ncbi:MAG TPA: efflux RND transporter periplasmic adaptor subunit [Terriglobales bacterium]|nr:efflux RND transporter periplasmic adaptor subunit [Terriglobales bacterium]
MKVSWLALQMVAVLILAACETSKPPATVAAAPPQPVESTPPVAQENTFTTTGPIVVENQVDVLALRAGVISAIQVDIGAAVHKDDLLAKLDDRQILAERDAAAAKMRSSEADLKDWEAETGVAEADFKRAQAMRDAGINTQEQLDHAHYKLIGSQYEIEKAKQDLSNAQNNLRAMEIEVEKTRITAPFDGVVARRYVRVGQTIAVGDRLFWLTAVAPLQVKFTLPERLLGALKKGQTVAVSSADISPSLNHAAKVIDVSPVVDPSSGTIEVVAQIEGPAPDLRPGMLANIRIDLPR